MITRYTTRFIGIGLLVLVAAGEPRAGLRPAPTTTATTRPAGAVFETVPDQTELHNGHIVTDKVISGAQPEGEGSFKSLYDLGVKTIISVDGAKPDVTTARKYGIRYVHIPIGYDGVAEEEGKAIAKAIEEMPGKIYVHCHHGKHRSAAAVAVACVYNGMLAPERAEDVLKTFGTGANYTGLWRAAREARPVNPARLREMKVQFVETAQIGDFAERMVQVDRHWDHVKEIQKAGWKTPKDHPDLDAAHEVLQTQEHLAESARVPGASTRPAKFQTMLKESEGAVRELGEILRAKPVDTAKAEGAFKRASGSCASCHEAYRD